jgi:hypothetical protein
VKRLLGLIFLLILILALISYILIRRYNFFSLRPHPVDYDLRRKIRVEIINCSGVSNIARIAQDYLRELGFDVYDMRTSKWLIDKTTIIERVNPDLTNAREVADALSFQKKAGFLLLNQKIEPEVKLSLDSTLYLEVTVVLGKDFELFFNEERIKKSRAIIIK